MKLFFAPKAWQKIAPNTIEAWLASGDAGEQRLAEETLTALGDDKAREYLQRLLAQEADRKQRLINTHVVATAVIVPLVFGVGMLAGHKEWIIIYLVCLMTVHLVSIPIRQSTSILEQAIAEYALRRPDLSNLPFFLMSLTTIADLKLNQRVREVLPRLMEQVTPDNVAVIPESFLPKFVESLEAIAKQKTIAYIPTELSFAKAHITLCGNIRYAPALPALQAIAAREPKTPQERELQALAAQYVADWDTLPVITHTGVATAPDVVPLRATLNG